MNTNTNAAPLAEAFDSAQAALMHCPDRASIAHILDVLRARVDAALSTAAQPPAGMVMVPVEPTPEMMVRGGEEFFDSARTREIGNTLNDQDHAVMIYQGMLDVARKQSSAPVEDRRDVRGIIGRLTSGAVAVSSDGGWVSIRREARDEAVKTLRDLSSACAHIYGAYAKLADRAAAPKAAKAEPMPGIIERLEAALKRIEDGHGIRRIPADPTDPDLVLAECKAYFEGRPAPFWVEAEPVQQPERVPLTDGQIINMANKALPGWGRKDNDLAYIKVVRAAEAAHGIQPAQQSTPKAPLTADDLREPKNGANWRVEWWNESARLMLPANKRLDSFQFYKNGTLMFTLKERVAEEPAHKEQP